MNLFFQIQSLHFSIFCMDVQAFVANLHYVLLYFLLQHHQSQSFFVLLYYISTFNISFLFTKSLLFRRVYVSIESNDYILLSSLKLKAILVICSVKSMRFLSSNLSCIFNIDLFCFSKLFNIIYVNLVFFLEDNLFYSQVELLVNSFYNFQI